MPPQNKDSDRSFAVFPAPNVARAIPSEHHLRFPQSAQSPPESRLEELLTKIKRQYDSLAHKNENLRNTLHQRQGQIEEALQMSQLKDQYLQAAQRRIQELEQMVNHLKDIVAQMQNRESRLEACEQQIFKLERLLEELIRTPRDRSGALLLSEQNGVPELAQSVNELEVGTASKSEEQ